MKELRVIRMHLDWPSSYKRPFGRRKTIYQRYRYRNQEALIERDILFAYFAAADVLVRKLHPTVELVCFLQYDEAFFWCEFRAVRGTDGVCYAQVATVDDDATRARYGVS